MPLKPGTGYTPQNPVSSYLLDTLTSAPRTHAMDLSAVPLPDPADPAHWLNTPANKELFERRYGPGSFPFGSGGEPSRFKQWAHADQNERGDLTVRGLRFRFQQNPVPGFDGEPTLLEITDAEATGEGLAFDTEEQKSRHPAGFSADNPEHTNRPGLAHGPFQEPSQFIPGGVYYGFNDLPDPAAPQPSPVQPAPLPGPVAPPPVPAPPPEPPGAAYKHEWLAKVPWERMQQAFGGRFAWPLSSVVKDHGLADEALARWLAHVDGTPDSEIFTELRAEFGGG